VELEEAPYEHVMGVHQHRAQLTTEWIDIATGEIGRARVAPAHRESVRRFLWRFVGEELEVALEATTGWRFVGLPYHPLGLFRMCCAPRHVPLPRGDFRHRHTLQRCGRS
jgi:hypothetical protein